MAILNIADPLEKRFGWFRQLSGANYFASVRQFLEAEKKIRIKVLVKHGKISLSEVRETFQMEESDNEEQASAVLASLPFDTLSDSFELESGEEGIVYFVAGFIARSVLKTTNCEACIPLLKKSNDSPSVEFEECVDAESTGVKETYLTMVNRGGLVSPSDLVNVVCVHSLQLKKAIFDSDNSRQLLLKAAVPRDTFVKCFMNLMESDPETDLILRQKCLNKHEFGSVVPQIVSKFFNIFSKNLVAELNDQVHAARKRQTVNSDKNSSAERKIAKLQSHKL